MATISTPVGAIPEVVIPERNGRDWCSRAMWMHWLAIRRLIEDPELRIKMGQEAHCDHARHFEMEQIS